MRRVSLLLACSVLAFGAGSAQAAPWRLVEVSGTVRIAVPGAEAAPARLNQAVPTGSSVTTTLGARAALDNGLQHIVVGPNSRMTVAPDAGGFTRVMQDLGAVMFKVDKQKAPHFRVDTPLLAAIVKGTTFTVVVGPQSDSVNVAEGLVEVRSNVNDMGSDVAAGSSGAVSRDAPQSVQVTGTPIPTGGEPGAVKIEPLDYKVVSGGLVDSGAPTLPMGEALTLAASNNAAGVAPGAEIATPGGPLIEIARNDRQPEAAIAAGGSGGNGPEAGGNPLSPATPGSNGAGDGGAATESGNAGTNGNGNGNGNNGAGNGNGGAATETGNAGANGAGNGNNGNGNGNGGAGNGNGNGNGGAATENAGTNGNGNGNSGNGNGNGGAATENAGTNGNGNGNSGNGNGNGGAAAETGDAGTNGNGNGNSGNGNGNGGAAAETGNSGTNGNGNGNNGNGSGNGGSNSLVGGLLTTVGGVTDGLVGGGKGRGPK